MLMLDQYRIASDHLRAWVKPHGAELCRLQTGDGLDLLWDGDPAVWGRQAPVLFPVVGALKDGRLLHQGQAYPMPRHGFARDLHFRPVRLTGHSCRFRLGADAATRAMYPFAFQLELDFSIDGPELRVQYALHNPGDGDPPASAPIPRSAGRCCPGSPGSPTGWSSKRPKATCCRPWIPPGSWPARPGPVPWKAASCTWGRTCSTRTP